MANGWKKISVGVHTPIRSYEIFKTGILGMLKSLFLNHHLFTSTLNQIKLTAQMAERIKQWPCRSLPRRVLWVQTRYNTSCDAHIVIAYVFVRFLCVFKVLRDI